jgi:hypothetical protein
MDSSGARVHSIVYTFVGFLQPVDNPPVINTGNPGRTYPLKWQLKDVNGNYISDLASFVSLQYRVVTCGAFDLAVSSPLDTTTTGGTVLRYDASAHQFIYDWQTLRLDADVEGRHDAHRGLPDEEVTKTAS